MVATIMSYKKRAPPIPYMKRIVGKRSHNFGQEAHASLVDKIKRTAIKERIKYTKILKRTKNPMIATFYLNYYENGKQKHAEFDLILDVANKQIAGKRIKAVFDQLNQGKIPPAHFHVYTWKTLTNRSTKWKKVRIYNYALSRTRT